MLSVQERIDYSHLDRDIEEGKATCLKMAKALLEIRDRRLYRDDFDSFETYCEERHGISRQHGYNLCDFALSVAQLQSVSTTVYIPQNEWQSRPLKQLESVEEKADSLDAARTIAPKNQPDAGHIKRAVAAVKSKPPQPVVGQKVTVLDETSEFYGKEAEIVSTQANGIILECLVEGEENPTPFLCNEVSSDAAPKPERTQPAPQPKTNHFAGLQSELDVERKRVELLEDELLRLIEAIETGQPLAKIRELAAEIKELVA